jgi:hypothetical protein
MPNPLQQAGSQGDKQPKFASLFRSFFFTGAWTQRSPLNDPGTRIEKLYYGGRQDALITGVNIELSNNLTLIRRPGTSAYSLQSVNEAVNSFYSFKQFTTLTESIQVMMDGLTQIYTVTPAAVTSIYTKSAGAGPASMIGINNTLYIGDGIDQQAWQGVGATRNWGIAGGGLTLTSAYAGTGATQSGSPIATDQGPSGPNTSADSGIGTAYGTEAWGNAGAVPSGGTTTASLIALRGMTGPGGSVFNEDGTTYLTITGFRFNLPAGATINGIAASINKQSIINLGGPASGVFDNGVYLVKAGVIQTGTTDHTAGGPWSQNFFTQSYYGNSSDTWGASLASSDINDPGFGIAISAKTQSQFSVELGDENDMQALINQATVTVYYTPLAAPNWANPTNAEGSPDATYTTTTPNTNLQTAALLVSNYNFNASGTLVGVQVNITGHVAAASPQTTIYVQLQDNNGNPIGFQKSVPYLSTTDTVVSFGSASDLWGSGALNSTLVNSTDFGVQIIVAGSGEEVFIDAVQIVLATGGITVGYTGSGSFSATTGYKYVYEYSDSSWAGQPIVPAVFSNATVSADTGPFSGAANATIEVVASPDPQVNSIWVFRTTDGGSTFYSLPTNPYPNSTTTINDSNPDSSLNTFQLAAVSLENSAPPNGLQGTVFHMGRLWGFVNNVLYFATGPDLGNILGNPYESWNPANVFTVPSQITKLIPTTVGLIVWTISDIYIVYGNASPTAAATGVSGLTVFYVAPFVPGIGLRSQFAADVNGTTIYAYTADKQCISMDPSAGISEIGFPVGAPNIAYPNDTTLQSYDPAQAHVTWHVAGSQDKALYVADGSAGWFRCNTSQAPEGGFVWSPRANIVGGCDAVFSIETTPGVHQLLIGPTSGGGRPILYRNLTVFTDNAATYPANFTMGNIVLAYPGQMAELNFITCDFNKVGTSPIVSFLADEISGAFSSISGYVHSDPPQLDGTTETAATLFPNRYDFAQSVNGGAPPPLYCRHLQIKIDYGNDGVRNEILSFTLNGSHWQES